MTRAPWWWKVLLVPLVAVLLAFVALAIAAPLLAGGMLYHPEMGSRRAPGGMKKIRGSDGAGIAVLHLPNPQARFTLWFFHGNAEDLGDLEPMLRQFHDAGFAVFAADYPGFGLSDGRPSEAALYASARVARDYLRNELHVPASRTLLYGRSLGAGVAVQLATEERVGGLVVQSGFMSAFRVVTRWPLLPFDQFKNLGKMPRVPCPVLVMHGEADEVIAFAHGQALFAAAPEPKQRLWVPGAHHNDFTEIAGDRLWTALREFSALCAARP
jgi:fermentation-respiration switch protein FrsA (DUF1100 family)